MQQSIGYFCASVWQAEAVTSANIAVMAHLVLACQFEDCFQDRIDIDAVCIINSGCAAKLKT